MFKLLKTVPGIMLLGLSFYGCYNVFEKYFQKSIIESADILLVVITAGFIYKLADG